MGVKPITFAMLMQFSTKRATGRGQKKQLGCEMDEELLTGCVWDTFVQVNKETNLFLQYNHATFQNNKKLLHTSGVHAFCVFIIQLNIQSIILDTITQKLRGEKMMSTNVSPKVHLVK